MSLDLDDVFRDGSRLHVFLAARLDQPHCTATVDAAAAELVLHIDLADIAAGAIEVGSDIYLGFSAGQAGMLHLSQTRVLALDARRVTVAYPSPPFKMPRRDYARAPLTWSFTLSGASGPPTTWHSKNVSAGGVLLVPEDGARAPERGAVVRATFSVPDWRDVEVEARVVRHEQLPDGRDAIGLQFLDLGEIDETKIQLRALRAIGRRYLRVRLRIPCELSLDGRPGARAETLDLSGSGALLEMADEGTWRVGRRGSLSMSLDGEPLVVDDIALVRAQRVDGSMQLAIDFAQISANARTRLVDFLMSRLRHV